MIKSYIETGVPVNIYGDKPSDWEKGVTIYDNISNAKDIKDVVKLKEPAKLTMKSFLGPAIDAVVFGIDEFNSKKDVQENIKRFDEYQKNKKNNNAKNKEDETSNK